MFCRDNETARPPRTWAAQRNLSPGTVGSDQNRVLVATPIDLSRLIAIDQPVVRVLGYIVSAILMLGFIWIAVDRRRQGFHDKLAGTFVVYDDTGTSMMGHLDARRAHAAQRRAAA